MTGISLEGGAAGAGGGGLTPTEAATLASWGVPGAPNASYSTWGGRMATPLAAALDRLMFAPMVLCPGFDYTAFGARVAVAAGAGGVLRIGLYEYNEGNPGDLIVDGGTVASDSTGAKFVSIPYTATVPVVYVGLVAQVDATGLTLFSPNHNTVWNPSNLFGPTGECVGVRYQNSVSGALPTTPSLVAGYGAGNGVNFCAIAY